MASGISSRGRRERALRAAGVVLLACAILAPKVSLAVGTLFGEGYRSVVVCTGSGLKRLVVAPDGSLVDDVSEAWAGTHCVLTDGGVASLERRWHTLSQPRLLALAERWWSAPARVPLELRPATSSRGPPR